MTIIKHCIKILYPYIWEVVENHWEQQKTPYYDNHGTKSHTLCYTQTRFARTRTTRTLWCTRRIICAAGARFVNLKTVLRWCQSRIGDCGTNSTTFHARPPSKYRGHPFTLARYLRMRIAYAGRFIDPFPPTCNKGPPRPQANNNYYVTGRTY